MSKSWVARVLVLVLLVAVAAAAAGLGGAGTAPAAQAGPASLSHWCNFVLAGKNATADGSVLMGYNNDWSANNYATCRSSPATPPTTSSSSCSPRAACPEGGINVHQLGVNYGTVTDLDPAVLAADPYVKKGYGGEIWDVILQQCTTAQAGDRPARRRWPQTGFSAGAAGSFGHRRPGRGLGLRAARRPPLGRAARARQRRSSPTPTSSTIRQIDLSDTGELPRLGRPRVLRAEHRPLRPVARARSTSPGPTATATSCSPTTTPTACGARSTRSPRRSASRRRCPTRRGPCTWCPTTRSRARTSRASAATTTRARASTRRRATR